MQTSIFYQFVNLLFYQYILLQDIRDLDKIDTHVLNDCFKYKHVN